jgi:hypothetical protein
LSRVQDKRQQEHVSIDDLSIKPRSWETPIQAEITIDADAWRGYTFRLTLGGGAAELSGVEVLRDDEAAPLNSWRLQQIPLALFERALRGKVNEAAETWDNFAPTVPMYSPEEWPDSGQRERSNRDDLKLARLAQAYVETLGQPQQSRLLSERFSYAPSSVPKLIRRARERHLLTATTRGSSGGALTPRAKALLGEITAEQLQEWERVRRKRQRFEVARAKAKAIDGDQSEGELRELQNEILKAMQDLTGGEVVSLSEVAGEPPSGSRQTNA